MLLDTSANWHHRVADMAIETTRLTLGKSFSEGARLLWKVMTDRQWSQGELARAIGAKPGVVPRWLYGDTKPSWDWAKKIHDLFGIAFESWTLAPEIEFVPPAARADDSGTSLPASDEPHRTGT